MSNCFTVSIFCFIFVSTKQGNNALQFSTKKTKIMANLSKSLSTDLSKMNMSFILRNTSDYYNENVTECDANEITIFSYENGIKFYSYKLPKSKLIDFAWVMNKWVKSIDNTYESFAKDFKKILEAKGYKNSLNVYPTTYGIGIFVVFSLRKQINTIRQIIDDILTTNGIEYKNTISDAGWVFQYKISKSQKNIEKIKAII